MPVWPSGGWLEGREGGSGGGRAAEQSLRVAQRRGNPPEFWRDRGGIASLALLPRNDSGYYPLTLVLVPLTSHAFTRLSRSPLRGCSMPPTYCDAAGRTESR